MNIAPNPSKSILALFAVSLTGPYIHATTTKTGPKLWCTSLQSRLSMGYRTTKKWVLNATDVCCNFLELYSYSVIKIG